MYLRDNLKKRANEKKKKRKRIIFLRTRTWSLNGKIERRGLNRCCFELARFLPGRVYKWKRHNRSFDCLRPTGDRRVAEYDNWLSKPTIVSPFARRVNFFSSRTLVCNVHDGVAVLTFFLLATTYTYGTQKGHFSYRVRGGLSPVLFYVTSSVAFAANLLTVYAFHTTHAYTYTHGNKHPRELIGQTVWYAFIFIFREDSWNWV